MPQFTLNVVDSAAIEATVTIVEDTAKAALFHIYISRLHWKTYLQNNRTYRIRIPAAFKTGPVAPYFVNPSDSYLNGTNVGPYTGTNYASNPAVLPNSEVAAGAGSNDPVGLAAYFEIPLTGLVDSNLIFRTPTASAVTGGASTNSNDPAARGDTGGSFGISPTLSLSKQTYLGSFRASGSSVKIHFSYILETKNNSVGSKWETITEDDGNITTQVYKFTWDNGVTGLKNYSVEIYHDPDVANHSTLPTLYTKVATAIGQSITIGYHTYTAVADPVITKFKPGSTAEFSLHIPKDEVDDNIDTTTTAEVDDFDTVQIPLYRLDLFSFALQKDTFSSAPTVTPGIASTTLGTASATANFSGYSSLTGISTERSTVRNNELRYFANLNWDDVFIDQVDWVTNGGTGPMSNNPNINSKSFSLHSGETRFYVDKQNANSVLWRIQTGLGTLSKTILDNVYIVPFVPPANVQGMASL